MAGSHQVKRDPLNRWGGVIPQESASQAPVHGCDLHATLGHHGVHLGGALPRGVLQARSRLKRLIEVLPRGIYSVAFCSPAKSLTFCGLMEHPLVGVQVLRSKQSAPKSM